MNKIHILFFFVIFLFCGGVSAGNEGRSLTIVVTGSTDVKVSIRACSHSKECVSGQWCLDLFCQPRPACALLKKGATCKASKSCQKGLICLDSKCKISPCKFKKNSSKKKSQKLSQKKKKKGIREECSLNKKRECKTGLICERSCGGNSECGYIDGSRKPGQKCENYLDCKTGHDCTFGKGTCTKATPRDHQSHCDHGFTCKKGLHCTQINKDNRNCAYPKHSQKDGANCFINSECSKKSYCDKSSVWKCRAFAKIGRRCGEDANHTIQKCDFGLLCKKYICTRPLSKIGENCMNKNCKKGLHCTNLEQGPVCTKKKEKSLAEPRKKDSATACDQLKKIYHNGLLKLGEKAAKGKHITKSEQRLIAAWKLALHSLQCDVQHP